MRGQLAPEYTPQSIYTWVDAKYPGKEEGEIPCLPGWTQPRHAKTGHHLCET